MVLSSRPSSPVAIWLVTDPYPPATWNEHDVPASGFPGDVQTLWEQVRQAWKWWDVDVVAGPEPGKPHAGIGFVDAFGNYPGGGQANIGSWKQGGIQAWVFANRFGWDARLSGMEAVHESGHVFGGFQDICPLDPNTGLYVYTPGFWMGNPYILDPGQVTPAWTPDHRQVLDPAFVPKADLNFDGKVDMADVVILRDGGGYTATEAINVGRNYGKQ